MADSERFANFRHVLSESADVALVLNESVLHLLLEINVRASGLREAIDDVHDQVEAIEVVEYRHVERSRDGAFFLVVPDMKVGVIRAAVGQPAGVSAR